MVKNFILYMILFLDLFQLEPHNADVELNVQVLFQANKNERFYWRYKKRTNYSLEGLRSIILFCHLDLEVHLHLSHLLLLHKN
jgi:hypothetical protein